jgi:hypothetical protein
MDRAARGSGGLLRPELDNTNHGAANHEEPDADERDASSADPEW